MSRLTDAAHQRGLKETLRWANENSVTPEDAYAHGVYCEELRHEQEAVKWYKKSADAHYVPAMFRLAYCYKKGLGVVQTTKTDAEADRLFKKVIEHDKKNNGADVQYRLGMCYTYGWGTPTDEAAGWHWLNLSAENEGNINGDALYELSLYYRDGKAGLKADKQMAEYILHKAYEAHCGAAIFELWNLHEGPFSTFPYKRELTEACCFELGRLLRVAEAYPNQSYYMRVADYYRQGFPGDGKENREKFQELAKLYETKALALPE